MTWYGRITFAVLTLSLLAIGGCKEQIATPDLVKLTRDAVGHYCNMIIADHPGPKVQIHEQGREGPLWFSSVRDGFSYMALPGEAQKVSAIYVHDMGRANSWDEPQGSGIWVKATEAIYVIGSTRRGGMGAQETVPFKEHAEAAAFISRFGGQIVSYSQIPRNYLLSDETSPTSGTAHMKGHGGHDG